jgi:hypothetical protein
MTTQTLHLIDEYLMQGGYTPGIDAETLEREAHLVAAAPDLLAALEWWQAQMRDDNCDDMGKLLDDMSAKAHAAITKAKGN